MVILNDLALDTAGGTKDRLLTMQDNVSGNLSYKMRLEEFWPAARSCFFGYRDTVLSIPPYVPTPAPISVKVVDNGNEVDDTTKQWIANESGYYLIMARFGFVPIIVDVVYVTLSLYINDGATEIAKTIDQMSDTPVSGQKSPYAQISTVRYLSAGTKVDPPVIYGEIGDIRNIRDFNQQSVVRLS